MSKTNTSSTAQRGSNITPKGTYTKSMMKRFKLSSAINDVEHSVTKDNMDSHNHRKAVKRLIQSTKIYRSNVHGVHRGKLPRLFVNSAHYFADYIEVSPNFGSMPVESDSV
jgi:hypothetical protein